MIPVVKSLSVEGAVGPSADKFLVRKPTQEEAEAAVRTLLLWAGDDPSREGLVHLAGMVVLLSLMAVITYFDIVNPVIPR